MGDVKSKPILAFSLFSVLSKSIGETSTNGFKSYILHKSSLNLFDKMSGEGAKSHHSRVAFFIMQSFKLKRPLTIKLRGV